MGLEENKIVEYPFGVGKGQEELVSGQQYTGLSEVSCGNAEMFPIVSCSQESDLLPEGEVPKVYFNMQFARTEYEHEIESIKNGKGDNIDIRTITHFRHNFKTIVTEETLKYLKILKHFKLVFWKFTLNGSSFIFQILDLEISPTGSSEEAEHEVEVSFYVKDEKIVTELCCDPPSVGEFNLNNCDGDGVFSVPRSRCANGGISVTGTKNPDGTTTISTENTGDYDGGTVVWTKDGETVGTGTTFTATEAGTYCAYSSNGQCSHSACYTVVNECVGTMTIQSSGCNTIFTVSGMPNDQAWSITLSNGTVINGTGNTSTSVELPYGDYTAEFIPKVGCTPSLEAFQVEECEQDCNDSYDGYSINCEYNNGAFTPTMTGDTEALELDVVEYTVNGVDFAPYNGGGVAGNTFAAFTRTIKKVGCKEKTLFTACGKECCPEIEFPDTMNTTITNTVQVEGDFCCPEGNGNNTDSNCPEPTRIEGTSNIVPRDNEVYGIYGTYFTDLNFIHYQTADNIFVSGGGGTFTPSNADDCAWDVPHPDNSRCSRLNQTGIWVDDPNAKNVVFALCVNIVNAGTYAIGGAADNQMLLKIDGQPVLHIENNGGVSTNQQLAFFRWYVCEKYLTSGKHIIIMEATNLGSAQTVGFEIYNATVQQLQALTTKAEIDSMVLFHSRMIDNLDMVFNVAGGLACPEGTTPAFDGCNPICDCPDDWKPNISKVYLMDLKTGVQQGTVEGMKVSSIVIDGVEKVTSPIPLTYYNDITHHGQGYNPSLPMSLNNIFENLAIEGIMADLPTLKDMQHLYSGATVGCPKRFILRFNPSVPFSIKVGNFTYTNDTCLYKNSSNILSTYGCYIAFEGTGEEFTPFISIPD